MEYKLLINGQWVNAGPLMEVKNKYDGKLIAGLPTARRRMWTRPLTRLNEPRM